jgi:hypothetical protein
VTATEFFGADTSLMPHSITGVAFASDAVSIAPVVASIVSAAVMVQCPARTGGVGHIGNLLAQLETGTGHHGEVWRTVSGLSDSAS